MLQATAATSATHKRRSTPRWINFCIVNFLFNKIVVVFVGGRKEKTDKEQLLRCKNRK